MGAGAAGAASVASIGLSAYGSVLKGQGEAAGDEYKAEQLARHAEVGKVKAEQTGAQMTEQLNQAMGGIVAVRAASHDDPTSPTGVAISDWAQFQGDRQKNITVDNILEQADQDTADAAYMRTAAKYALSGSYLSAAAGVAKGVGTTNWKNFGFGGSTPAASGGGGS